jgi:formiminoglutamase
MKFNVSSSLSDPRLGALLLGQAPVKAALLGFPYDEGVRINGGRMGARLAPREIRRALHRLTPDFETGEAFLACLASTEDLGDLACINDIVQDQQALAARVSECLEKNILPIVLGGGHETSYGHFLGYAQSKRHVSILNFDAHPDVRERREGLPHSGSSFRDALLHESGCCRSYAVMGLQPQSCAAQHLAWLDAKGQKRVWAKELTESVVSQAFSQLSGPTLVSIDMDVVDQAFAPGVSAPASGGISPALLFHIAHEAGKNAHVSSFDIAEVNPSFDRDDQTSRLAAVALWHFFRGVASRLFAKGRPESAE